ncbi:GDSL-type esterase/lipase family protein [Psychrobacillus sp. FJAT-51614]|uniref:GDSL-type esterase/lipase family protein n=1 Tax=Psychrobacillus mangrovi TaxID=3117745 RepID=A0ABU8F156_9BACI
MRKCLLFLVAFMFFLFSLGAPIVQAENAKIDYVALGDSLASGHTPYGDKVGRGFTDMISEAIAKENMLGSFTKEYATSGETSVGLLETLKRGDVQQSLKNAELITIISGANDFIDEMYNPNDESINTDLTKATALLNKVAGNMTTAIQQVKALNPEADIYLFGYYFPLPHLKNTESKKQIQLAFSIVNNRLATLAKNEGVHFVEVASAFDKNGASYLENPKDIHPNEAGYKVLADQFLLNYSIPVNGPFPNHTGEWGNKIDKPELVAADKMWTVTLTKGINPASVKEAVYVVKDDTKLVPVGIEVSIDNKQILISPPKQGYKPGAYQLMITNKLTDKSGGALQKTVLVNFKVK